MHGTVNSRGRIVVGFVLLLSSACAGDEGDARIPEMLDLGTFNTEVYPVLLRDCGFVECHGSTERFLQVFGPGRARLPSNIEFFDPPTAQELAAAYERARSMVDEQDPVGSLLLRKPLEESAGGAHHLGLDTYHRDVYRSTDDPGYQVLRNWVSAPGAAP